MQVFQLFFVGDVKKTPKYLHICKNFTTFAAELGQMTNVKNK